MEQHPSITFTNDRIVRVEVFNQHLPAAPTLAIIPTYNESENIIALLEAICALDTPIDILIADDASPDNTAKIVTEAARRLPRRLYVMHRSGKHGLGICYLDAFRWALDNLSTYNCLIQMDADFSHHPSVIPSLVQATQTHSLAIGSRYVLGGATPDWNRRRIFLSHGGNFYARTILRLFCPSYSVQDNTAGFMAWRRNMLEVIVSKNIPGDGYAFLTVLKFMTHLQGQAIKEVPITFCDRRLGVSKLNRNIIFEAILMPWRLGWKYKLLS